MRLLTPRAPGGVAVLALSSSDERERVLALLRRPGGEPARPSPRPQLVRVLRPDGDVLDEGLLVESDGDLELHLHGSEAVLQGLEAMLGPLVPAGPVSAADALLRTAIGESQVALALEQLALEPPFEEWVAAASRPEVEAALARTAGARALAVPFSLVLTGRQNAGKSTLMNRLLMQERVLAGDLAGLTRDPVREVTLLDGYPYALVDVAGEGPVVDAADVEALDRARAARADAAFLLVVDGSVGPLEVDRALAPDALAIVRTKGDLSPAPWPADLPAPLDVTCVDVTSLDGGDGLATDGVRARLGAYLRARRGLPAAGPAGGPAALDAAQERLLRDRSTDLG